MLTPSPKPPLDREAKRRLAVIRHVEEVSGNVALTCRYYGISRQAYYIWYRRYQAEGIEGLRTRSKRPKTSPNATHAEVVQKIIHLRQNYHFGPEKISMYLKRYHDVTISRSGVWRILKRLDMGRLPASQRYKRHDRRWKRYEKQLPGHRVQIDVKFIEPIAGTTGRKGGRNKYYQFTAIDDCTRLRVLEGEGGPPVQVADPRSGRSRSQGIGGHGPARVRRPVAAPRRSYGGTPRAHLVARQPGRHTTVHHGLALRPRRRGHQDQEVASHPGHAEALRRRTQAPPRAPGRSQPKAAGDRWQDNDLVFASRSARSWTRTTSAAPSGPSSKRPASTRRTGHPARCDTASSRCSPTPACRSRPSRAWSATATPA